VSTIDNARGLLEAADEIELPSDLGYRTQTLIAKAQALATIALAEEQRTANLIAYLPHARDKGYARFDFDQLRDEVESRLGLTPTTTSGDEPPY